MSSIRSPDFDRWLRSGLDTTRLVLLHGPDEGLVRQRASLITQAFLGSQADDLSRVELDGEAIAGDPGLLADETQSISMFSTRRVILLRNPLRIPKASWSLALSAPPAESLLIFIGDDIKKENALRAAFETSTVAVAIPCYPLSQAELGSLIDQRIRQAGLAITPPARALLIELFGIDSAQAHAEIEKLLLYARGSIAIEPADVEAVIADASTDFGTESIDLAFEGNTLGIDRSMQTALRDGATGTEIIIFALAHIALLRRLLIARDRGNGDTAFRAERLHFRREARIRQQSQRWSLPMLARAGEIIATAQEQSRRQNALADIIALRALWSVSLAAARQRG